MGCGGLIGIEFGIRRDSMLMMKAFHIIAMVAWFSGLFYLPRLFVYHADAADEVSLARFKTMEWRLYYGSTWPAGVSTSVLGVGLIMSNLTYYAHASWMHAKLFLVMLLWAYHLSCGHYRRRFFENQSCRSSRFFRIFNEIPTLLLIGIVLLVVLRP